MRIRTSRPREEWGRSSALYGAAGVVRHAELTRVLLEAGASPDDGESLYHSTEAEDVECLRLLLQHGAETRGTNALARALDFDRLEAVRLLLEAGADPDEHPHVAHAVRRGRGPEFVRLLVEHGADVDRPGAELWGGNSVERTPYAHAVPRGRDDVAATLAGLAASTGLAGSDAAVAAVARGARPGEPLADGLDADAQQVLVDAALGGHLELVLDEWKVGLTELVGGPPPGTLLHWAAWYGAADAVEALLARGADPRVGTTDRFATPVAWAAPASGTHSARDGDHLGVVERLVAAGAELEPRFLDVADGPLREWLQLRLPGEL